MEELSRHNRQINGVCRPPFRQVITQKKAKFCCSQTVKSSIFLSQNAGNVISETLDGQNFPGGGGMRLTPPPPPPLFQNPGSAPGIFNTGNSYAYS